MQKTTTIRTGSSRAPIRFFALLAVLLAAVVSHALAASYLVYVGTYTGKGSDGIYAYRFDPNTGEATPLGLAAATENPSFLATGPQGQYLYAVNEVNTFQGQPTGGVSTFAIDRQSGKLKALQQVSSLGQGPAHLSLDKTARYLLVANYDGGNVAVFPIGKDGRLGPRSALVQHTGSSVNKERQAGPHAHEIAASNDDRFVLAADLGLDELLVYRFDAVTGTLTPNTPKFAKLEPGAGPRHFAFAPSGRFVYVVNEMASTVTVFSYDAVAGTLQAVQTVPTLPKDFKGENTTAEIATDLQGRFLYVSNRGDDSIAVFAIDATNGKLSQIQRIPTGGKEPRNFAIDPTGTWLFAANQNSNDIRLFRVDRKTGRLTPTSHKLDAVSPVSVVFVPVP